MFAPPELGGGKMTLFKILYYILLKVSLSTDEYNFRFMAVQNYVHKIDFPHNQNCNEFSLWRKEWKNKAEGDFVKSPLLNSLHLFF